MGKLKSGGKTLRTKKAPTATKLARPRSLAEALSRLGEYERATHEENRLICPTTLEVLAKGATQGLPADELSRRILGVISAQEYLRKPKGLRPT